MVWNLKDTITFSCYLRKQFSVYILFLGRCYYVEAQGFHWFEKEWKTRVVTHCRHSMFIILIPILDCFFFIFSCSWFSICDKAISHNYGKKLFNHLVPYSFCEPFPKRALLSFLLWNFHFRNWIDLFKFIFHLNFEKWAVIWIVYCIICVLV